MQGDRGLLCVATTISEDWSEELVTTGSIAHGADLQAQASTTE
jgi:hypothetical protein